MSQKLNKGKIIIREMNITYIFNMVIYCSPWVSQRPYWAAVSRSLLWWRTRTSADPCSWRLTTDRPAGCSTPRGVDFATDCCCWWELGHRPTSDRTPWDEDRVKREETVAKEESSLGEYKKDKECAVGKEVSKRERKGGIVSPRWRKRWKCESVQRGSDQKHDPPSWSGPLESQYSGTEKSKPGLLAHVTSIAFLPMHVVFI